MLSLRPAQGKWGVRRLAAVAWGLAGRGIPPGERSCGRATGSSGRRLAGALAGVRGKSRSPG